jgi:hypothetical protein
MVRSLRRHTKCSTSMMAISNQARGFGPEVTAVCCCGKGVCSKIEFTGGSADVFEEEVLAKSVADP